MILDSDDNYETQSEINYFRKLAPIQGSDVSSDIFWRASLQIYDPKRL